MRRQPDLTINGLPLPLPIGGHEQSYEDFGAFTVLRLGTGAAVHQEVWRKIRTTITGEGIAPPGLAGLDWSAPITLGCIAARSIQSASNIIALPAARRIDAPPYGWAVTSGGLLAPTSVTLDADVATLTPLVGALSYQVLWYPLLTVRAPAGLRTRFDAAGAVAGWELVAEEV